MFDVSSKVICINSTFPPQVRNYLRNLPVKGTIYTVRDIIPANGWKGEGTCAVLLREIANPPAPHRKQWGECGFSPDRFREPTASEIAASISAAEPTTPS